MKGKFDIPVIKTREGFEDGGVQNVVTWHARNEERVCGYDAQCVVRIRRVAIMQRGECRALIWRHFVRRITYELLRGQASTWHHEQRAFSRYELATGHGTCCHATFALSSDVLDAKATGLGLVDGFVHDRRPAQSDYLGKDAGCDAFYAPGRDSRQHDILGTLYVRRQPRCRVGFGK